MRPSIIVLLALLGITFVAGASQRSGARTPLLVRKTNRVLDINRIALGISDRGNLDPSALDGSEGYTWRLDSPDYSWVAYDHGPWIIGKTASGVVMGNTYWGTSYMPGPVIDGRPALDVRPQDSLRYHPYKISRTSLADDPDLTTWPTDLGAPSLAPGLPAVLGDQMIWTVFNGADSTARPGDWQPTAKFAHMPVEIHQTVYAHAQGSADDTSLLANCAFMEWTFINKGAAFIESCYVGLWTDIDLVDARTPFGVDTATQTGYCWEYQFVSDTTYCPRAAGYTLMYGPRVPDRSSAAMFRGRRTPGYRNLPMSSFWGMRTDYGTWPAGPTTVSEAWNVARGFDKLGQVIIDSVTRQPTRFPWSGDPVTGTGWVYRSWTEFEGGFMLFTGPFTFAPGDTQWTLIALHPAAATASSEAISAMRHNAARLRALSYDEITAGRPLAVEEVDNNLPSSPMLQQSFPNPFNPATTIRYGLPARSHVLIAVFNVLGQRVAVLQEGEQDAGYHEVRFDASGLASGIYMYRIQAGRYTETKKTVVLR